MLAREIKKRNGCGRTKLEKERWLRGLPSELEREIFVGVKRGEERKNESTTRIRVKAFGCGFIILESG